MSTRATKRLSLVLVSCLVSWFIQSFSDVTPCVAGDRFSQTGTFVLTPAGQMRFTPDAGNPNVIYELGDAPENYYDYLGVRVRVDAVVEVVTDLYEVEAAGRYWLIYNPEEARGNARPVRTILLGVERVTPLDPGFKATRRTTLPYYGTPGTDPVQIAFLPGAACYSWGTHLAVETADPELDTATLRFLPRDTGASLEKDCSQAPGREIMTSDKDDSCYFLGGAGDAAIVDCGTGPDPRRLMVLDLKREAVLLDAGYFNEEADGMILRQDRRLEWTAEVPEPSPRPHCPEAAQWKEYGLSICYKQLHTLDLGSGAITAQGAAVCSAAQ